MGTKSENLRELYKPDTDNIGLKAHKSIFDTRERSSAEERIMVLEMHLEDALRRLRTYEKLELLVNKGSDC